MTPESWWWVGFNMFVLAMLTVDLGVFHRRAHEVSMREALAWSAVWISIAVVFNIGIYLGWFGSFTAERRTEAALEFLTGYLIELSLSVDNVFVFALLFEYFHVPLIHRHRVLFWGILGALVMRATMIFAGIALLHAFHWIVYVFGALLVFSGIKLSQNRNVVIEPDRNPVLRLVRRLFPVAQHDHGARFFARENGAFVITPLFVVLLFVEWSDLVFAIDSIPAILAVTDDAFIVYTSNALAMLGLRSLYLALAGVMDRFHLLHYGLAAILVFVGAKMLLADVFKIPTAVSLAVVATILIIAVVGSLLRPGAPQVQRAAEAERRS